jgi:hypothetical protein
MIIYDTYGTSIYTAAKLARIAADRLGLTFTERESDYRGIYYRADVPPYQIEVQPNVIPADDGQDDLYTPTTRRPRRCCSSPACTGHQPSTQASIGRGRIRPVVGGTPCRPGQSARPIRPRRSR